MLLSTGAKRSSRFPSWDDNLCTMHAKEAAEDDGQRETDQMWEIVQ